MLNRITVAAFMAVLLGLFAGQASAAPPTDFWQNKHFMNMAHAGGAKEGPANTLFAFKQAVKNGADSLEMDGYVTADNVFVVTHDLDPYSTSNIQYTEYSGMDISEMTLPQLKTLDFAYKFKPGEGHFDFHADDPDDLYPYRGMALEGGPQPPAGYTRNDFRIATFKEVLDAFPHTPINIDMKAPYSNQEMATEAADVLADLMADYPERSDDVIVASFFQGAMERFHELLPSHHALTASEAALLGYVQGNPITPTPVALQPPDNYDLPPVLDTVPILKEKAEADGYAIHVWPQNGSVDGPELWQKMIDQGADGFFTDFPSQMHRFLCEKGIPRPDGSPRCAEQRCPRGYTGFAPDNCVRTPGLLSRFKVAPKKRKLGAGRRAVLRIKLSNAGGKPLKVRVKLRSSNRQVRVKRSVMITIPALRSVVRRVPVKATWKARRRAVIKVRTRGKLRKSVLKIKPKKRKAGKRQRR